MDGRAEGWALPNHPRGCLSSGDSHPTNPTTLPRFPEHRELGCVEEGGERRRRALVVHYSVRHVFYEVGFQEPTNASANLGLRRVRRRIGPWNLQAETGRRGGKDSLFTRTQAIQAVFEINGMNREEGLEADHHDTHLQESRGMFDVPLPLPVSPSRRTACAMGSWEGKGRAQEKVVETQPRSRFLAVFE